MSQLTHYCIVRVDLPFGVMAAQLIHAAGESASLYTCQCASVKFAQQRSNSIALNSKSVQNAQAYLIEPVKYAEESKNASGQQQTEIRSQSKNGTLAEQHKLGLETSSNNINQSIHAQTVGNSMVGGSWISTTSETSLSQSQMDVNCPLRQSQQRSPNAMLFAQTATETEHSIEDINNTCKCLSEGTYAVCLAARDESHLLEIEQKLQQQCIPHNSIREPDAPYLGAIMAIGIVPCERKLLRRVTSYLPLLK